MGAPESARVCGIRRATHGLSGEISGDPQRRHLTGPRDPQIATGHPAPEAPQVPSERGAQQPLEGRRVHPAGVEASRPLLVRLGREDGEVCGRDPELP